MSQVFVSYASTDSAAAQRIERALKAAGMSVDSPKTTSPPEIKSAQCILIVWSRAAAESESLQEEVRRAIWAWSSGRLLIAVLDDAPLPIGLRDVTPIRIGGEADPGLSQLVLRAKAIVAASQAREAAAKTPSPPPRATAAPSSELLPRAAAPSPAGRRSGRFRSLWPAFLAICVALVIVPTLYYVRFAGPPGGFGPSSTLPAPLGTTRSLEPHLNPRAKPASSWASEWLSIVIPVLLAGVAIGAVGAWVLTVRARRREGPLQIVTVTQNPTDAGLQVFVSYSHLDAKTVDGLVHQIEGMGYAVWIDRDTSGTHRYAEAIVHAIRTSKLVALMCSRNAFASDQVIREIYVAGDFKKPFIAFQLDLADFPDEVLYFISGFPRIPIASVDPQQLRTELDRLIAT